MAAERSEAHNPSDVPCSAETYPASHYSARSGRPAHSSPHAPHFPHVLLRRWDGHPFRHQDVPVTWAARISRAIALTPSPTREAVIALATKGNFATTRCSPPTSKQTLSGTVGIGSAFTAAPAGAAATWSQRRRPDVFDLAARSHGTWVSPESASARTRPLRNQSQRPWSVGRVTSLSACGYCRL